MGVMTTRNAHLSCHFRSNPPGITNKILPTAPKGQTLPSFVGDGFPRLPPIKIPLLLTFQKGGA